MESHGCNRPLFKSSRHKACRVDYTIIRLVFFSLVLYRKQFDQQLGWIAPHKVMVWDASTSFADGEDPRCLSSSALQLPLSH